MCQGEIGSNGVIKSTSAFNSRLDIDEDII